MVGNHAQYWHVMELKIWDGCGMCASHGVAGRGDSEPCHGLHGGCIVLPWLDTTFHVMHPSQIILCVIAFALSIVMPFLLLDCQP